jgi:hypothetical protein
MRHLCFALRAGDLAWIAIQKTFHCANLTHCNRRDLEVKLAAFLPCKLNNCVSAVILAAACSGSKAQSKLTQRFRLAQVNETEEFAN